MRRIINNLFFWYLRRNAASIVAQQGTVKHTGGAVVSIRQDTVKHTGGDVVSVRTPD